MPLTSANTLSTNKTMKNLRRFLILFVVLCLSLSACGNDPVPTEPQGTEAPTTAPTAAPTEAPTTEATNPPVVDYAGTMRLDLNSSTAKAEVTVKNFVDGDTVHFFVPEEVMVGGVLKARFLAVNTPESTGKIEEYGKAASNFTKEKLSGATSIILESESDSWDFDTTGGRYLVWIWYKTDSDSEYRNLNVELLQNGLARANNSSQNQYGGVCVSALNQAQREKLNLYSGQKDPGFYYGDAVELTLRELRTNIESYSGMKVAFNGIVTMDSGTQGVYVEDFDEETGLYYGIYIYYGHNLSGTGLEILSVGNEVRIVGSVQFYEGGGTWQVSDMNYRMMRPNDPGNIQKLSDGHSASYVLTDADTFVNGTVTVEREEGTEEVPYAAVVLGTSVEMKGLKVVDVYTTNDEESSSYGAMTLTCEVDGVTVSVRTAVLYDQNGQRVTEDAFLGKTIDVKGVVDYFDGAYQIKVFATKNITIE